MGRIAWRESRADAARRLSCLQGASGVHRGLPWVERVNFVRDVASSGTLEEYEMYVQRDYSGGRQGSCQPIILNGSGIKR